MEKQKTFEEYLKRLEEIVRALENGDTPLDESMKLFEEGVSLSATCNELLEKAEQKVSMLTRGENGEMQEAPMKEMQNEYV